MVVHFKLVLLGDSAVGKSCLVVRFVRDEFYEHEEPTIGAAFLTQTVSKSKRLHAFLFDCIIHCNIQQQLTIPTHIFTITFTFTYGQVQEPNSKAIVKFEIWDTAGQERYRSLAPMYYRGAAAAIVVFDITKRDSYNGARSWVKELQKRGDMNVVIALAGNKCDMEAKRRVETEDAFKYAQDNEIIFMETSAKENINVRQLFLAIASKLPTSPPVADKEAFPIIHKAGAGKAAGAGKCC